jgi:hypothetical protein
MKIAIHSLPRSGTKNLVKNFQSYLKSLGGPLLHPNDERGLDDPFNFEDEGWGPEKKTTSRMMGKLQNDYTYCKHHPTPVSIENEIQRRFKLLLDFKYSWVYRRVPFYMNDPILYDSITRLDKCIAIIKDNVFEHCLSYTLADQLKIWDAGPEMNIAISKYTDNKIILDKNNFKIKYEQFCKYNNIKWIPPIVVRKFEEMVKIKNSKEFCDFFEIPFNDFIFSPFEIEFGSNKFNMIGNIEELKYIVEQMEIELCNEY